MESNELLLICGIAFLMVFLILAVLSVVMRVIMILFPGKKEETDAATIAALTATVHTVIPGTKITMIEEQK